MNRYCLGLLRADMLMSSPVITYFEYQLKRNKTDSTKRPGVSVKKEGEVEQKYDKKTVKNRLWVERYSYINNISRVAVELFHKARGSLVGWEISGSRGPVDDRER